MRGGRFRFLALGFSLFFLLAVPVCAQTGTVSRVLPKFTPTVAAPVTVNAVAVGAGGALTVREITTVGLTVSNVTASVGTTNITVAGGDTTILWTLNVSGPTTATLSYNVTAPAGCDPKFYIYRYGNYDAGTGFLNRRIAGDVTLWKQPDSFPTPGVPWFDHVDIPSTLLPKGFAGYYSCDNWIVVWADGNDIWNNADQFHFLYLWVQGQFEIRAECDFIDPVVDANSKIGVHVRADLTGPAPMASVIMRRDRHIIAQERVSNAAAAQRFNARADGTDPNVNSRVVNTGSAIFSLSRPAGSTRIDVGFDTMEGSSMFPWYGVDRPNIPNNVPIPVGLCFTSHQAGTTGQGKARNVTVTGNIVNPTPTTPAAPSNLTATALSATRVQLGWSDNSNNETGFKIERKVGTGAFVQIDTASANVTSYLDMATQANTSYTYRIRATNAAGDSAFSNEIAVTTPAPALGARDWNRYDMK